MKDTLLVVDLSNQVYKAMHSHLGLTSGTTFTGGLFGFIIALCSAIKEVKATRVVVAADSKPYIRSRDYPNYKKLRKKETDEEMIKAQVQSMSLVRELCDELGLPIWAVPGFEYDDLLGHCVVKYRHRYQRIVAMSNDSDMHQFFWWRGFAVYRGGKAGPYVLEDFKKEWPGLTPQDLPLALSITGTHNDIEGIHRVGPAGAIKAILDPVKMRALRAKHAEVIDRNLPLIALPHPGFPFDTTIPSSTRPFAGPRSLYKFCSRYDITVTPFMTDALERVLR